MPSQADAVPPVAAESTDMPRLHEVTNGVTELHRPTDLDPAVVLLIQEVRRGNDALRSEMVAAQKDTTKAIGALTVEMRELRKQAPGRLSFYLAASVVVLALVSTFALVATRGVDPQWVARATGGVAPTVAPSAAPGATVGATGPVALPVPPAAPQGAQTAPDAP